MKRTQKKGFTIVELIIVIAVVAILAAVLIPTFVGLVKKANLSADQQAVRQMNTALIAGSVEGKPTDINAAAKILADAGYNAAKSLIPVTADHAFYWYATYNRVILVSLEGDTWELVAPTNERELAESFVNDKDTGVMYNLKLGYSKTEAANVNDLKSALENGENVVLAPQAGGTVELPVSAEAHEGAGRPAGIVIPEGQVTSLDLGGNELTAPDSAVAIVVEGEMVLTNGTVSSRGITVVPGGRLTIGEGVTVISSADNGGAAIRNLGGIVTINGGTFTAPNGDMGTDIVYEPGCIYNTGYMEINGGTFDADSSCYAIVNGGGKLVINNATVDAFRGAISVDAGEVIINGGTFKVTGTGDNVYYAVYFAGTERSTVTINGGTFTTTGSHGLFGGSNFAGFVDNRN